MPRRTNNATNSLKTPPGVGISDLLGRYRCAVLALEKVKAERFYHGTPVTVDDERYRGPGIAVTDGTCWPDFVAVALPNGNTWRYPMENVRPNNDYTTG